MNEAESRFCKCQHTCWPCEDWKSWATAAKASELCSGGAGAGVELVDTTLTGSLAGDGGEPESWDRGTVYRGTNMFQKMSMHNQKIKKTSINVAF